MNVGPELADDGFRPRQHYLAMIWVWGSVIATTLLYMLFVQLDSWRPHVAWWILTTAIIVISVFVAAWLLARCFIRRKHRTWAIASFMLTITPLVWFASNTWATLETANTRADLKLTLPLRGFAVWVGSWFELEARWRYPRITEGKHVQLFDNGQTPNVQLLVKTMDQHIESMAKTLEHPISKTKTRWVRGSVFGQNGRAVGAWALCDTAHDTDRLEYLDRHEVAHTVITMMCPVSQDMPMLFAEGWAQSNSSNRADSVLALYRRHKDGEARSLVNLTSGTSYGKSKGDAYSVGGPMAWYLLERFGGAKFVELYGGVERDHFEADVLRILGITWQQVDQDFWNWLERQAKDEIKNRKALGEVQTIFFDRVEDKPRWTQIVAAIQNKEQRGFPERLAIKTSNKSVDSQLVFAPGFIWSAWKSKGRNSKQGFEWLSPDRSDSVLRMPDGSFDFNPDRESETFTADLNALRRYQIDRWNLQTVFKLDFGEPKKETSSIRYQIHSITEGVGVSDPWRIEYSTSTAGKGTPRDSAVLEVDPRYEFELTSIKNKTRDGGFYNVTIDYVDMGGRRIAQRTVWDDQSGNQRVKTIDEMSVQEIDATKQAAEDAVLAAHEKAKTALFANWRFNLVSPQALAVGWPLMTLVVFGIHCVGRVRIRVPNKS